MTQDSHELEDLSSYSGHDKVVHIDLMRDSIAKEKPKKRISIGIGALDKLVDGIEGGELIAIGGPTKNGKTLLAQTLTRNIAETGAKVLWFTFEVPIKQFSEQMPKTVGFYVPQKLELKNLSWLFTRIAESKQKYAVDVVFIDNLHHLFDIASSRNSSLDIGVTVRHLKRMAILLDVTIFILCHSRKPSETKGQTIPEVSEWDLRDSSFIPQESDSTWMIQRKQDKETKRFTDKSFVKVCNHRRTGVMGDIVHLVKTGLLLEEDVTIHG